MAKQQQLINAIIDDIVSGLYSSKSQAISDLIGAGLSLEEATLNVDMLSTISMSSDIFGRLNSCPFEAQDNQTCIDRIRQLRLLGYI